jgi:hypothetical protein
MTYGLGILIVAPIVWIVATRLAVDSLLGDLSSSFADLE